MRFDAAKLRQASGASTIRIGSRPARSCLACGTCAFACPTCHCFDIQDEMAGGEGVGRRTGTPARSRCSRCTPPATTRAPDQAGRWRQRLSHKFRYYPEKFGQVLCTGCGRCIRLCPAGMDLLADRERRRGDSPAECERAAGRAAAPLCRSQASEASSPASQFRPTSTGPT